MRGIMRMPRVGQKRVLAAPRKPLDKEGYFSILEHAERGFAVFPIPLHPDDWWDGPHLDFPETVEEQPLLEWYPARCDFIKYADGPAVMDVGFESLVPPLTLEEFSRESPGVAMIELTKERIEAAANFTWQELTEGRNGAGTCYDGELSQAKFLELAFYGTKENRSTAILKIRMYPSPWLSPEIGEQVKVWNQAYFNYDETAYQRAIVAHWREID